MYIAENNPFLVERRQVTVNVALYLGIATRTAVKYLRHAYSSGSLVPIVAAPGGPVQLDGPNGDAVRVWVGDPRPRIRRGLYFTITADPPRVGPHKPVTFVMTPRQIARIVKDHTNAARQKEGK